MKNTNTLQNERAIGYHINRIIQKEEKTLEQIAESMEIPEIHLRAIITGSIGIRDEELKDIADKLGVDVQELLKPVPDEELYNNNLHCMGTATCPESLDKVLDKIDVYVRLLNLQSND